MRFGTVEDYERVVRALSMLLTSHAWHLDVIDCVEGDSLTLTSEASPDHRHMLI